jgi:hypothetical protein
MTLAHTRRASVILALVSPFLLQAALVIIGWVIPAVPWSDNLGSILASCLLGLWFLCRAVPGPYTIPVATVYLPAMAVCLFGFTLGLSVGLSRDSL